MIEIAPVIRTRKPQAPIIAAVAGAVLQGERLAAPPETEPIGRRPYKARADVQRS